MSLSSDPPADKLFTQHLRFETCHRNVAPLLEPTASVGATASGGEAASRLAMLKLDAMEAVELLVAHGVAIDMVFVDCEKKTQPLMAMLRAIMCARPSAVIVGDDHVFDPVQAAVAQLHHPHVVVLPESYMLLPDAHSCTAAAAQVEEWRARLTPPAAARRLAELLRCKDYVGALKAAVETCNGSKGDVIHQEVESARGELLVHEICRGRDHDALSAPALRGAVLSQDAAQPWCPPLLNAMNLTPFDYLTHWIKFE